MIYRRIFSVVFSAKHSWPGRLGPRLVGTRHGGQYEVPRPSLLSLEARGPDDLILRFLDHAGTELTHDHPHDVQDPFASVEQEFGIRYEEWERDKPT